MIVDRSFEILHTIHDVGDFLRLPAGQASLNLLKMLPKELAVIVSSLLRRAEKGESEHRVSQVMHGSREGLELSCRRLESSDKENPYYFVSFHQGDPEEQKSVRPPVETIQADEHYLDRIEQLEKRDESITPKEAAGWYRQDITAFESALEILFADDDDLPEVEAADPMP